MRLLLDAISPAIFTVVEEWLQPSLVGAVENPLFQSSGMYWTLATVMWWWIHLLLEATLPLVHSVLFLCQCCQVCPRLDITESVHVQSPSIINTQLLRVHSQPVHWIWVLPIMSKRGSFSAPPWIIVLLSKQFFLMTSNMYTHKWTVGFWLI